MKFAPVFTLTTTNLTLIGYFTPELKTIPFRNKKSDSVARVDFPALGDGYVHLL